MILWEFNWVDSGAKKLTASNSNCPNRITYNKEDEDILEVYIYIR